MVKNKYSLPLISKLILQLYRARYFTKLDICQNFNNVYIKSRDKQKAVFQMNQSFFEPLVIFFSMTNSPITFQTMINDIFQNLIAEEIVMVYLDDILIFTRIVEKHVQAIQRVLEILAEYKLFLHLEKCKFQIIQIEYLGLVISKNEISIDLIKIAKV